jgi:hypothetical protein
MTAAAQCLMILSTKSAGSSAVQELVCNYLGGRHVGITRHAENETLYWTKAASALALPQIPMLDSEVPIARRRAMRELRESLVANLPGYAVPADTRAMIFEGWQRLCLNHAPLFVEKSPHHLLQRAALELVLEAMERTPEVTYKFLGLIRNPMDALYSAWSRWRSDPERHQHQWRISYENLLWFRSRVGEKLVVLKYEDFPAPGTAVDTLASFVGAQSGAEARAAMHASSIARWRSDPGFGFRLAPAVAGLALDFGYARADLENQPRGFWPVRRTALRLKYRALDQPFRRLRRATKGLRSGGGGQMKK